MNKLIKSLIILYLFVGTAAVPVSEEINESEILRALDNICGDTWCEGQFDFDFKSFRCYPSSTSETLDCVLEYAFFNDDPMNNKVIVDYPGFAEDMVEEARLTSESHRYEAYCHFKNISSYDQLMASNGDLNEHFYENVTSCVSSIENFVKED